MEPSAVLIPRSEFCLLLREHLVLPLARTLLALAVGVECVGIYESTPFLDAGIPMTKVTVPNAALQATSAWNHH